MIFIGGIVAIPPSADLLEGFNSVATGGGGYDGSQTDKWYSFGNAPVLDSVHRTEGTQTWKLVALNVGGGDWINAVFHGTSVFSLSDFDGTGYTQLSVDYYIDSIGAGNSITLGAFSAADLSDIVYDSDVDPTGSGTLTVSITGIDDITQIQVLVGVTLDGTFDGVVTNATSTIYIDNLVWGT